MKLEITGDKKMKKTIRAFQESSWGVLIALVSISAFVAIAFISYALIIALKNGS